MKRLIVAVLTAAMLLSVVALIGCEAEKSDAGNTDVTTADTPATDKKEDDVLDYIPLEFVNEKLTAENEDAGMELFFTSMMNKVGRSETESTGEYAYLIKMAKNEYDSCQVMINSTEAKEGLSAEITPFVHESGTGELEAKLEFVYYHEHSVYTQINPWSDSRPEDSMKKDYYPELIMPMAETFEIKENRNQHFIITATSAKDSPAGMYKATFNIKDADGKVIKTANVYVKIWDFTVPDTPYSASLFCNAYFVNPKAEDQEAAAKESLAEYYEHMLSMNLSSYILPVEITSDEADAYMDDPRVTAFVIAGGKTGPNREYGQEMYGGIMDESDEDTIANYNKVASKEEWFNKGMFYYTDEPTGERMNQVKYAYEYVTELLGTTNIRNMTPFYTNSFQSEELKKQNIDLIEFIKPYINVWAALSPAYHDYEDGGKWTSKEIYEAHGNYSDRVEELRERGDTIWWYVCISPQVPYANYFTYYQGVVTRLLSWQQYMNDVDGVLYFSTRESWSNINNSGRFVGSGLANNGDGTLQYPGEKWGYEGPQASWRLLQIRDGFDDFDYLKIAEELCGREAVMKVVDKVSTGMLEYTEDYRVLEAAREEIVEMILAAQK